MRVVFKIYCLLSRSCLSYVACRMCVCVHFVIVICAPISRRFIYTYISFVCTFASICINKMWPYIHDMRALAALHVLLCILNASLDADVAAAAAAATKFIQRASEKERKPAQFIHQRPTTTTHTQPQHTRPQRTATTATTTRFICAYVPRSRVHHHTTPARASERLCRRRPRRRRRPTTATASSKSPRRPSCDRIRILYRDTIYKQESSRAASTYKHHVFGQHIGACKRTKYKDMHTRARSTRRDIGDNKHNTTHHAGAVS